MPVESVAAYINNTFTFVMFILVCTILFFIILAISTLLKKRILKRNTTINYRKTDVTTGGKSFNSRDPFERRNSILLGLTFILVSISVILILASYYFSLNMEMGVPVYIISFIILVMIAVLAYMFKSGGID